MIVKKSRKGQRKGQTQKKSPETLEVSGLSMAAGEGFEFAPLLSLCRESSEAPAKSTPHP